MLLTSALNAAGERPHNNIKLLGTKAAQTGTGGNKPLGPTPKGRAWVGTTPVRTNLNGRKQGI